MEEKNKKNAREEIEMIQQEMKGMQVEGRNRNWERWKQLKLRLDKAYKSEEEYWKWKSVVNWLQEGDSNTKFFHAVTAERMKRNRINMIQKEDGTECWGEEEIAREIANYFENVFTTTFPQDCEEVFEGIPRIVTESMNINLTKPVEGLEIRQALFTMHPNKAPGPDGMTPLFFQHYWPIIGYDICMAVKAFFHSRHMLTAFNHTLISLIPKVKNSSKVSDFQYVSVMWFTKLSLKYLLRE